MVGVILTILLLGTSSQAVQSPPIYGNWRTYTTEDGLPNNHIYWVEVDDVREDCVWLGTDEGLACLHPSTGEVEHYTPEDGLGHQAVMAIAIDPKTGDLWIATFGGLTWFSGGKFRNYTQDNSGLASNVVFGVAIQGDTIWAATTAGASRFIPRTNSWMTYSSANAPFEENWCYNAAPGPPGKVFIAAWGGGILEYDVARDYWQAYKDPDKEFEIDLFPNDGLVHDIITAVSYEDSVIWASTYFGLSIYDHWRRWNTYFEDDSGLASEFINMVRAQPGTHIGWICTDKGLSVFDYDNNRWVTYKPLDSHGHEGVVKIYEGGKLLETFHQEPSIGNQFVLSVDFEGEDVVWVGTEHGVSRGVRQLEQIGMR